MSRDRRPDEPASNAPVVIPVAEERLRVVGRAAQERERVRVTTHVDEEEVILDAPYTREDLEIVRVPVGREVEEVPPVRTEGDTTIVPLVEEVVVVQRRKVLREELRITKRRTEETRSVRTSRRVQRAEVERVETRGDNRSPSRPGRNES